jgi:Protein of unknown function (DUF1580)
VIDLASESPLIPLAQVPALLPPGPGGNPVHVSTVWRWVRKGLPVPAGERVRLEAVRLGGRLVTSIPALQRFAERLTGGNGGGSHAA